MGTDVVKLNDKKYMLKLEKNIQQEYEVSGTCLDLSALRLGNEYPFGTVLYGLPVVNECRTGRFDALPSTL